MARKANKGTRRMTLREYYTAYLNGLRKALANTTLTEEQKWYHGYTEEHVNEIEEIIRKIDNGEIENSEI